MDFRPCIDIHNGKVKQIVGSSLRDSGDFAKDNFVSDKSAAQLALLYRDDGLKGGHIIMLNSSRSPYAQANREQALAALSASPGYFQAGGGINSENAALYLDAGACAVIVTSYVFSGGRIDMDHLTELEKAVGKESLVLDLSFREKNGRYYIVTDRWQKFTDVPLAVDTMDFLAEHCCEFLIHAADVEGLRQGPNEEVLSFLGEWDGIPVTYAGGIVSLEDLQKVRRLGKNRVHVTVGSALDLFGGTLAYREVVSFCKEENSLF